MGRPEKYPLCVGHMMDLAPNFTVRLAKNTADLHAVQRLRYDVFVRELGASGEGIDHDRRLEQDAYDPHCLHLMLLDLSRGEKLVDQLVGVYRLLTMQGAEAAGSFYSASEFDLLPLLDSKRPMIELGRSCLRKAYRGGEAMFVLWQVLAKLVMREGAEILFGTASFAGTDIERMAQSLSLLHEKHMMPLALRPKAVATDYVSLQQLPQVQLDRIAALKAMPALIKAYLRLGGGVGDGAYVDHGFNTIDVCLVLDIKTMNMRQKAIYFKGEAS